MQAQKSWDRKVMMNLISPECEVFPSSVNKHSLGKKGMEK